MDNTPKVDIHQPLKVVFGGIGETSAVADASVIKQGVQMWRVAGYGLGPVKNVITLLTVHGSGNNLAALLIQKITGFGQSGGVNVGKPQVTSGAIQPNRQRAANAVTCALYGSGFA